MTKESEYKKIYIQEADELLQMMNTGLLQLEEDIGSVDALNSIFRACHTLKSMSASMGYNPIADLSHKMEDVLAQVRDGTIELSENGVDLLFKSFDKLEAMVGDVTDNRKPDEDISDLVKSLDGMMEKGREYEEEKITDDVSLNIFEKRTLARARRDSYLSYHVKIRLEDQCVLKSVRAFMVFRALHDKGEVIKSFPNSELIELEKFDNEFGCILVTKEKPEDIIKIAKKIMDVVDVFVEEIPVDELWDKELASLNDEVNMTNIATSSSDGTIMQSERLKKVRSVRVDIENLDKMMNLVEELAINKLKLSNITIRFPDSDLKGVVDSLERLTDELQNEVMKARLVPVGQIFDRFPRLVRDLARKQEKEVAIEVTGSDIELDRTVLDEIGDPLIHLIRNAVDHGIETPDVRKKNGLPVEGRIELIAAREKSHVVISVIDDGSGMDVSKVKERAVEKGMVSKRDVDAMNDHDALMLVTRPGFSTNDNVTEVSGRGVGLDVVKERTESLGGSIQIETKPGKGTRISMRLPITTAVVQALLVRVSSKVFAIPVSNVSEIIVVDNESINHLENIETIMYRDSVLPLIRLKKIFFEDEGIFSSDAHPVKKRVASEAANKINVVVLDRDERPFGVAVDSLISQQDIVIKQLAKELKGVRGFAGATILGDGSVALVLDVASLT